MTPELQFLLLFVLITCVGFIGAINSQGTARTSLSYLLALICLAVTSFHGVKMVMDKSASFSNEIAGEATKIIEEKMDEIESLEENLKQQQEEELRKRQEMMADKEELQKEINDYKTEALNFLYKVKGLNQKLLAHQLVPNNDDEYDVLVQRASYYLAESQKLKRQSNKLQAPEGLGIAHETLIGAVDVVVLAASRLRKFYTAENSDQEMALTNVFRQKTKQAASLLARAEQSLTN